MEAVSSLWYSVVHSFSGEASGLAVSLGSFHEKLLELCNFSRTTIAKVVRFNVTSSLHALSNALMQTSFHYDRLLTSTHPHSRLLFVRAVD